MTIHMYTFSYAHMTLSVTHDLDTVNQHGYYTDV